MKIIQTDMDLHTIKTINNVKSGNYELILFKSPAEIVLGGKKRIIGTGTAIMLDIEKLGISPAQSGALLHYDCIAINMNSFESQYVAELGIPFDKTFEIADDTIIRSVIRCVQIQNFNCERRKNEFFESALHMIFLSMSDQLSSETTMPSADIPHYKELYALRNSIYANPVGNWSIERICMRLGISSTYFHRLYFLAFGTTCRQDVINSRLSLAESLLVSTDRTVGSIAEQCGYDNDSYFMRQFKQQKGYTPSEYRRKFASAELNLKNE